MKNKKPLIFIGVAIGVLILVGSLLRALLSLIYEIRYHLEYILPYWLVSPVLFLSVCLLVILSIQYLWPAWKSYSAKNGKESNDNNNFQKPIRSRKEAALKSLESVDNLIDRLQDTVAKKGLKLERQRVGEELNRGDLVLVIFGTGSSGKTSLIRALLNQIVGDIGAQMGTTSTSKRYRLKLKGLQRGIQLIDTPGILEAGNNGLTREREARLKASNADLMIVVTDSDLRSSEMKAIKTLSNLGKKLIIVLNKCDLRGEQEEKRLLGVIWESCKDFIEKEDVIATSASPQTIPRTGGRPFQPPAEIDRLLRRLSKVLHEDGEELLADNILLQCRNLGKTGRKLLNSQRSDLAKRCVDRYSWISGGVVAATPLPVVDLLGTAAVNAQMVIEIAKVYGVSLTKARAQELAVAVGRTLAGLGVVQGGLAVIGTALSASLPTLLVGRVVQGVAAAWLTKVAGGSFITYFQQNQDWGDGGIQEVVQRQYELNKRESSLERFVQIAIRRVVDPIRKNGQRQLPPRPKPRGAEGSTGPGHQE